MDDPQVHGTIEQLVAEEHPLWQRESAGGGERGRPTALEEIRISLDQCWDLLRQRRARAARPARCRSTSARTPGTRTT